MTYERAIFMKKPNIKLTPMQTVCRLQCAVVACILSVILRFLPFFKEKKCKSFSSNRPLHGLVDSDLTINGY